MSSFYDVVVVGAGVAGLSAASTLLASDFSVAVLEAGQRVGGRAWTVRPPSLGGAYFEMGAIWLHAAERNPLVPIARQFGETLVDADAVRQRRLLIDGRPATPSERADYDAAWDRYEAAADRLIGSAQSDLPLASVASSIPDDPWAVTIETWEGPVICVAEAGDFSLRDWKSNLLDGGNILVAGGLGDFISRRLPPASGVFLGTPVSRIRWDERGGVAVETQGGTLQARACIVTVSTGVLAAGAIAFEPELPPATQEALAGLPMGLALKVVLRAAGEDRLGLPPFTSIARRFVASGDPAIVLNAWPWGYDYVSAWIGASTAWELTRAGPAAAEDFMRAELRTLFGADVDRTFLRGPALVSHWGTDPCFRGAYAYARPGCADARRRLGEPIGDGRLVIAGEATHPTLAGTVGGAWLAGEGAAESVIRALRPRS